MWRSSPGLICLLCCLLIPAAQAEDENKLVAVKPAAAPSFSGFVSWYGKQFHGKKTASGEVFDMYKFTSAHRTLPFATRVLVEDPRTGNAVIVKVNDRGPFCKARVMDVSMAAAKNLGTMGRGMAYMDCLILKDGQQAKSNL